MIDTIRLHHFRNFDHKDVEFKPGINAVIGSNGLGKTNLLEALFFVLQGRSMRTSDAREMVRKGERAGAVEATLYKKGEMKLKVVVDGEGSVRGRRRREDIGAACFQPDDIWMVKGGPEIRRRYLDEVAAETKREYKEISKEYQRVLKQRNEAIKMVRKRARGKEFMRGWNQPLCRYGSAVVRERSQVLRNMQEKMAGLGERWGKGGVELKYYTSMGGEADDEKKTLEKMERMEEAEIMRGTSMIGPHRDEITLFLAGKNARRECSQGEQKLMAIMWRLAQAEMMGGGTGKSTILLMDDCLSELDEGNRRIIVKEMESWAQVVVTATDDMAELAGAHRIWIDGESRA